MTRERDVTYHPFTHLLVLSQPPESQMKGKEWQIIKLKIKPNINPNNKYIGLFFPFLVLRMDPDY